MSEDNIDVKNVSTTRDKPKTHNTGGDRFNPSNRIYVRAMTGVYQKLRQKMGWLFMLLFLLIPWVPFGDRQAILLDIGNQQFNIFGTTLWPQDLTLLATIFVLGAFGLFFATTFLGRVWCGYLCPQTVWTFIFIWFEEKFEGPANKRRKQDEKPLSAELIGRKTLKHLGWLSVSLVTGLTFVGYFVPIKTLTLEFFTASTTFWTGFWVIFFSACTYGNAGWMRSIMCLHICPYARFQSVMFDKDTFIVGYDEQRGESRGPRSKKQDHKALGLGDCVDCNLCVQVCPTGIDIRDGLQYECINCGACIDACDHTMDKMNYSKGLISYTTEHKLSGQNTDIMRPKLLGYGAVLLVIAGFFMFQIASLQPMALDVLRDRAQLSRTNVEGLVENTYTLKILNKTQQPETYRLSVKGIESIEWYGKQQVTVDAGEIFDLPISLGVDPYEMEKPIVTIYFVLERESGDSKKRIETESRFIGKL
ncbi:cytochrome c oxidase accessory protein CcoG [Veronia nyctiphanis]|uniref:Cytochrome c oxidase accessory protein CcoG n=1 Tax=Veronia nyctiphanis TaxID=1278244 RepID=A0A4Q0YQ74_9GAMM|nr:cytochrome c oxidase accessory protein CcoG [Veronia nyctiphanis]RXJ72164.1 cytochrome c oxidase accessory protein CcoG [Veronia nyctiphanis]